MVTGAIVLPLSTTASTVKLNRSIFYLGSILIFFKILTAVYNLITNNNLGVGLIILVILLVVYSIFAFFRIKIINKRND